MKSIEKAFRVLGVTTEKNVILATYMVMGETKCYWELM